MTRRLATLGTFVGAIVLSIFAFMTVGHMPVISTIESPDKTYVVLLRGKDSGPRLPIIEHAVYSDVYRNGELIARGQKLHLGDWFDPAFKHLYTAHAWVNKSTLMFHRRKTDEGPFDTLNITNNSSKSIRFLRLQAIDMFLLFDLKPQARVSLSASPQTWLSWVTATGEFEDGTNIRYNAENFQIDTRQRGPFTYDIKINEDGPTISSSQLRVYR
jgi:hypothetical protein